MIRLMVLALMITLMSPLAYARTYGEQICKRANHDCYQVRSGDSWEKLFPNAYTRDVMKRLNRMNIRLKAGMTIAIPHNYRSLDVFDISPMPATHATNGRKTIVVNQKKLAWGAYSADGRLVKWGPMSGGKSYCADVGRGCRTATGEFTVYSKRGANCRSSKYPVGRGGAKMPHCMFFHGGYALHGSWKVVGRHDSHGCVRMFLEDAKWLYSNFVELGKTRVIVGGV